MDQLPHTGHRRGSIRSGNGVAQGSGLPSPSGSAIKRIKAGVKARPFSPPRQGQSRMRAFPLRKKSDSNERRISLSDCPRGAPLQTFKFSIGRYSSKFRIIHGRPVNKGLVALHMSRAKWWPLPCSETPALIGTLLLLTDLYRYSIAPDSGNCGEGWR